MVSHLSAFSALQDGEYQNWIHQLTCKKQKIGSHCIHVGSEVGWYCVVIILAKLIFFHCLLYKFIQFCCHFCIPIMNSLLFYLRTFAPIATAHLFAHVTHTSFIVDHAGKHDAKGAKIFHKNGT